MLHEVKDVRLNHEDALKAKTYLEKSGYDVMLSKHFPGIDGIDLDNIIFEELLQSGKLEQALKRPK